MDEDQESGCKGLLGCGGEDAPHMKWFRHQQAQEAMADSTKPSFPTKPALVEKPIRFHTRPRHLLDKNKAWEEHEWGIIAAPAWSWNKEERDRVYGHSDKPYRWPRQGTWEEDEMVGVPGYRYQPTFLDEYDAIFEQEQVFEEEEQAVDAVFEEEEAAEAQTKPRIVARLQHLFSKKKVNDKKKVGDEEKKGDKKPPQQKKVQQPKTQKQ